MTEVKLLVNLINSKVQAGGVLTGHVRIDVGQPIPFPPSGGYISLLLYSEEYAAVAPSSANNNNNNTVVQHEKAQAEVEEVTERLWQKSGGNVYPPIEHGMLLAGTHSMPFSIELPSHTNDVTLPVSFSVKSNNHGSSSSRCGVQYWLSATFVVVNKPHHQRPFGTGPPPWTRTPVVVEMPAPKALLSSCTFPVKHLQIYSMSNDDDDKGRIALGVRLPSKSHIVIPGETLSIAMSIQNLSTSQIIHQVDVKLVETIEWNTQKKPGKDYYSSLTERSGRRDHRDQRCRTLWQSRGLRLPGLIKSLSSQADIPNEMSLQHDPETLRHLNVRLDQKENEVRMTIPADACLHFQSTLVTCKHRLEITLRSAGTRAGWSRYPSLFCGCFGLTGSRGQDTTTTILVPIPLSD